MEQNVITTPERVFSLPRARRKHSARQRTMFAASALGLVIGTGLVLYPFWPRITYRPHTETSVAQNHVVQPAQAATAVQPVIGENRLRIPKIGVDIPVLEGDESVLNKGAWHLPDTSSDPTAGNMVISAHRYKFLPPASDTFYLLDKVNVGDTVILDWNHKEYTYRVMGTQVVKPTELSVLADTKKPQLMLLTCTPLFSTAMRLVVSAVPVSQ